MKGEYCQDHEARAACGNVMCKVAAAGLRGAAARMTAAVMPYNWVEISYTKLSCILGVGRRQAMSVVNELEAAGILTVERPGDVPGLKCNRYRVAGLEQVEVDDDDAINGYECDGSSFTISVVERHADGWVIALLVDRRGRWLAMTDGEDGDMEGVWVEIIDDLDKATHFATRIAAEEHLGEGLSDFYIGMIVECGLPALGIQK